MVFRRSRGMALRPINRIKHVVDTAQTMAAGALTANSIALATDTPTLAATASVETGSKINGFYIRIEVASIDEPVVGGIPNVYFLLYKNPGGNIQNMAPNSVGANDNKRFVIHQEMIMIDNRNGATPRTLFNGVIVVPKGMRAMRPNDDWRIMLLSPVIDIAACMQIHYKEFR